MWCMRLDMSSTLSALLLVLFAAHASAELPFCKRYQACAAEVSQYPLLSETVGNMVELEDGSGEASGEAVPIYDEFVETATPFDFGAQPALKTKHLCRCVDSLGTSQEGNATDDDEFCNFRSPDHVMSIDQSVRLTFCQPVQEVFRAKCRGARGLVRVIGQIHETGEALSDVVDTAVFCRCDSGFRRVGIEPWHNGYSFTYQCVWTPYRL